MNHRTTKGSIIIYALLLMSAILAASLSLSAIFLGKFRAVTGARDSAVALYAADSAAEMCLYMARFNVPLVTLTMGTPGIDIAVYDGSGNQIEEMSGGALVGSGGQDCAKIGSESFQFRAVGSYRSTTRALEIAQ